MHLSPHEMDKLPIVTIGLLSQRRLARGLRLNYPESVALISLVILELIRDGQHSVSELMHLGQTILGKRETLPNVSDMIKAVHIEGTFPDGTKLVAIPHPVTQPVGSLNLALYGSFLPHPQHFKEIDTADIFSQHAGKIYVRDEDICLNEGRPTIEIDVTNTDTRPIQVGSHFHFTEANSRLEFNRNAAHGKRLNIPAGNAVRFPPGETHRVTLVEIAGHKVIRGGNGFANGKVNDLNQRSAFERTHSHHLNYQEA